jgi:hypothetical protein
MTRLPIVAAAVLAIAASAPVICATTSPASAQEWRDRDDVGSDLRDLLRDRIRTRADLRDLIVDLLHERQDLRGRLRERISGRDREEDEEGGGWRGRLRERFAERMAERHHGGGEEGECYFLTRSLRDSDGDFFVLVRRRICRD